MSQSGDVDSEYGEDSTNFWMPKQYIKTVKRLENSHKLCQDLVNLISERAEIEKHYSSNLKKWNGKWIAYLESGAEYGTAKHGWQAICTEALEIADLHSTIRTQLIEEAQPEIKKWQKDHFHKSAIPTQQFKEVKALETEFEIYQKPWSKKLKKSNLSKKDYFAACKQEKSLSVQLQNAKNDSTQNAEQLKKLEEKYRKSEKEVEKSKATYQAALNDLEGESGRYMEEMEKIFKKAQVMEQERIEYFKEMFENIRMILNITKTDKLSDIFDKCKSNISEINSDVDLKNWSNTNGAAMVFMIPQFEEYTPELSSISNKRKTVMNPTVTLKGITSIDNDKTSNISKSNESLNDIRKPIDRSKLPSYDEAMNPFSGNEEDTMKNGNKNTYSPNVSIDAYYDTIMEDNNKPGVKVRALYDYRSQEDDELNLTAGEIFEKLTDEDEQGWCKGRRDGVIGLYPANYADPI